MFGNLIFLGGSEILFAEKCYGFRKVKFLNVFFLIFLVFLKNYPIKCKMKSSIDETECESFFCRSDDVLVFCKKNVMSLGKFKCLLLFSLVLVEN